MNDTMDINPLPVTAGLGPTARVVRETLLHLRFDQRRDRA
jgi:hypothetical protein